jgi:hypothetical protein
MPRRCRAFHKVLSASIGEDAVMFAPKVAKPQTKTIASSTNSLARQRSAFLAHPPSHNALEQPHMLQRSIGNQATLRLLAQRGFSPTGEKVGGDHEQEAHTASPTVQAAKPGLSWDFSKIPIFPPERPNRPHAPSSFAPPPQPGIQRKLVVGQVNDPLEHEADRVADQVMRMPDSALSFTATPPQISRKCAACEEEERAKMIRSKPAGSAESAAGEVPPIVHEVLRSPGQALDAGTRAFFEPRFGRGFSHIRVHTDERAAASAREAEALAYTFGPHIAFAHDQYEPKTEVGRRLLAHELAHTLQQQAAGNAMQRQSDDQVQDDQQDQTPTPAGPWIKCPDTGNPPSDCVTCMMQCAEAGANCAAGRPHPYDPSAGTGYLFRCKGGWPTWTCSYRFPSNGDVCTGVFPFGAFLCDKGGGKQ